jgi:predicted metal-binding membrane protein
MSTRAPSGSAERVLSAGRGRRATPPVVIAAIAGAWILAVIAQSSGEARLLHHDALIEGDLAFGIALVLFLLAWQVMIAAMMLPSSLPLIRLFGRAAGAQERPRAAMAAFLGGYALIWTMFGWAAFVGDAVLHNLVDHTPWLAAHPWLIAGGVLVGAGTFQFTALKNRCLQRCRNPRAFILARYDRGPHSAFRLGRDHGLFCLGCCWALMLVMFAAGVANLWWMAALTGLMVLEKTAPSGGRSVPASGLVLLGWGALVLLQPPWLPAALAATP